MLIVYELEEVMTYVCSDIHGKLLAFLDLLGEINFSQETDHLYIVGDGIDRGEDGIWILQHVIKNKHCMTFILGNHEYMMLSAYASDTSVADKFFWLNNGGTKTNAVFECLSKEEQSEILGFLENCPAYVDVTVGGQRYHITHGWPADRLEDRVWKHPPQGIQSVNPLLDGSKLIVGHTVTVRLHAANRWEENRVINAMIEEGKHLKICKTPEFICIDCGCGHELPVSRLACLRLEDMKEFYVMER